ncbi:hypothetical protein PQU92_03775 [Asticcacaulis sp. BYS171W]|uniref:Uncharacterized protein n=1 Tax=Asticcacaulis aquaticus TaxID=2984212 RepID=A0ABT5HQR0_9CAUL|nr:hypothetical protein [Asticcacaulis aquaticus]MDC7682379.1 hypothetical protein [Asticcacaulis aquaticus]
MRMFKTAAAVIAVLSLAAPVQAGGLNPFSSSQETVAYAVEQSCLTWLRYGGNLKDYSRRNGRTVTQRDVSGDSDDKAEKLYGGGHVTVKSDGRGGCYIRGTLGNGADMRDAVLETLSHMGLEPVPFADYGPATRDRDWSYVQESYCVRDGDAVRMILISSSANRSRTPLQVSIWTDREGEAAKKGLCVA